MSTARSYQVLTEHESKVMLEKNGFPVTKLRLARTKEEAVDAARAIGFPVAVKIISPDIIHKSDANGVRLNLSTTADVDRAFDEVVDAARSYNENARIEGVSVQEFVSGGIEVIVGSKRDQTFGPVVLFGLGGIFVELFEDKHESRSFYRV
jgi:acyl-CoA synthetase (NDP forming)